MQIKVTNERLDITCFPHTGVAMLISETFLSIVSITV